MRKQIPIVQDIESARGVGGFVYNDTHYPLHKNGFIDVNKDAQDASKRVMFAKRPGLAAHDLSQINPVPNPVVGAICCAGALAFDGSRNHFLVYTDGTLGNTAFYFTNAVSAKPGAWALNGTNGMHEVIPLDTNNSASSNYGGYLWAVHSYATGGVVSPAGVVTQILAAAYTSWTAKSNMIAMDGYLFQADTALGYIYNSDLNAPTSWTATSRIRAGSYPGTIMRLMRCRNYIVAFKSNSIEFFENAGNPTPNSPLSAVSNLTQKYGMSAVHLCTETSDGIIFAGYNPSGQPGVFKLSYTTLTVSEVSDSAVSQILGFYDITATPGAVSDAVPKTYLRSQTIPFRDKEVTTFPVSLFGVNISLIFDNKLKTWGIWTSYNPNTAQEDAFPGYVMLIRSQASGFVGSASVAILFANLNTFTFSKFNENTFGDFGQPIDFKWISGDMDFGTVRRKFLNSLSVLAQCQGAGVFYNPTVQLRYRDSDSSTPVATVRSITWSTTAMSNTIPLTFRRLGSFHTRRFIIGTNDATAPIRFGGIELDIDMIEDDVS